MTIPSPLQKARAAYVPRYPANLRQLSQLRASPAAGASSVTLAPGLSELFPHTSAQAARGLLSFASADGAVQTRPLHVGVVLSGGPAPGGHNVIWGLLDGLLELSSASELTGFRDGPAGLLAGKTLALSRATLAPFRNTGGFDLLGTSRSKIDTPAKLAQCRQVLEERHLDALVIIGGDDSNTNAAVLAEYLRKCGSNIAVIGVPKTIDGDLQSRYIETTFGFDSAVRVYAEMISNICRDALSGRKLYHFVRLMGRAASHITLEAALQTQPTFALIAEEVAAKGQTLQAVVEQIGQMIIERAAAGMNYGVVLVPEGLIEFIPEMRALITELNHILAEHRDYLISLSGFTEQSEYLHRKLSRDASYTFSSLPIDIQRQLLMDRDPHGNVALSRVETEKLLLQLLSSYLGEQKAVGRYGGTFAYQHHFLGYEGRCVWPTNFDADYSYSLGRAAAALAASGASGYMAAIADLGAGAAKGRACGVPLLALMTLEKRGAVLTPVIEKGLVHLAGKAFQYFAAQRQAWSETDSCRYTGPIQYFGPEELTDRVPLSLALEHGVAEQVAW